jgi:transcriptional regulator
VSSRAENYARVKALRDKGLTIREITSKTGLSRSYVTALISDPTGEKDRIRKNRYRQPCPGLEGKPCGRLMDGSNGRSKGPQHCAACQIEIQHAEKRWTRDAVIAAIQRWAAEYGRPPVATDWNHAGRPEGYPPATSVYRTSTNPGAPFAKWADAIEAAGFDRPGIGGYERSSAQRLRVSIERRTFDYDAAIEMMRNGATNKEIAQWAGISYGYVSKFRCRAGLNVDRGRMKRQIRELLAEGLKPIEIAEQVGCVLSYVYVVRRNATGAE